MGNVGAMAVSVIAGLVGLAIVAVVVSKNANTSGVIQSSGSALAAVIGAAVGPVSGGGGNQFGSAAGGLGSIA